MILKYFWSFQNQEKYKWESTKFSKSTFINFLEQSQYLKCRIDCPSKLTNYFSRLQTTWPQLILCKTINLFHCRELKYEQDLEFYATARQLRWQKLKHQRTKTLKRLHKEKFEYRLQAQKTMREVTDLRIHAKCKLTISFSEVRFLFSWEGYIGYFTPTA